MTIGGSISVIQGHPTGQNRYNITVKDFGHKKLVTMARHETEGHENGGYAGDFHSAKKKQIA